jgi:glucosamine--fructose-6-phosphate aminotransferase (isomerizing)
LAYAAGELKHGPLALITEGTPVFTCFNSREANLEKLFSSLSQVQARGGVNYLITDELGRNAAAAAGINCDRWVKLPTVQRYEVYISPILAAVMLQLIAHEIAIRVNPNVDKPRNLAKSVTVE